MKFIAVIVFIGLSGTAVRSLNFGDRIVARTTAANSVHQQSQPNEYLSIFSNQQPLKKLRPYQVRNLQQKNAMNYTIQRPPLIYTPPDISFSASGQPYPETPYSLPPSNNQQSPIYVMQSFAGSTPQSNQLSYSVLLPLNCSKSSPTCLTPQPLVFSLPSLSPFHSTSRKGKLGASVDATGGILDSKNSHFVQIEGDYFIKPKIRFLAGNQVIEQSSGSTGPVGFSGFSQPSQPAGIPAGEFPATSGPMSAPSAPLEPSGSSGHLVPSELRPAGPLRPPGFPEPSDLPRRPFSPFTTPSQITVSNIATTQAGPQTDPETKIDDPSIDIGGISQADDDLNHPPHIHSLNVECSKTMMTINIEFNRVFDGIIYSKGYYTNPECTYVQQNSRSSRYSFTVNLNSCGTQFINDFEGAAGQAYLENVLVLQNEPGIQEVWDTVQRVRCLWEGNISTDLTVNLSVDMLNQEIVTFSGDTAVAKLDIQIGKGPFAPAADGLVKIGETMTLVVSVEGDPDFDLQVRDCLARDEASTNLLQLTDERGCILKPKLFGAFQKTKDTGNTGASIIAYAFFQAFKFPDVLDLFIECNIELCKTNCDQPCPEANQQTEPRRRRRSLVNASSPNNLTNSVLLSDAVRVGQRFRVIMLDDLSTAPSQILNGMEEATVEAKTETKEICMSNSGFIRSPLLY